MALTDLTLNTGNSACEREKNRAESLRFAFEVPPLAFVILEVDAGSRKRQECTALKTQRSCEGTELLIERNV